MARKYPIKDVKLLWGLAAGRCSYPGCGAVCILEASDSSAPGVIGDIAHVVSGATSGPRHRSDFPIEAVDTYANWVLLCPTHHRIVDQRPIEYPEALLLTWKRQHERWVRGQLATPLVALEATSLEDVPIFRLAARPEVWTPAPPNLEFNMNLWGDPYRNLPTLSVSTSARAAFAEVLARTPLNEMQRPVSGSRTRGRISEWIKNFFLGEARFTGNVVNLDAIPNIEALQRILGYRTSPENVRDLAERNHSRVEHVPAAAAQRRIRQEVGSIIREQASSGGVPQFDGLMYGVAGMADAKMIAIFSMDAISRESATAVDPDDPAFSGLFP